MQDASNSKQQIAEKIKQSANILVTVSANPSVDALTAALGLTLMLNKLDKHATAVFSGVVPPAISFLQPGKTFENNVDSLRDFIIALDKDKADRLRYKVEDDVVRIFITPYRTKISQSDLQFSQGDFNVDLIVALGVEDQKDLDQAITAHGRILHDATVVTVNAASQKSSLGSIDWQDSNASSLSEMLASMAETLKPGILDQQISTALLTGIVANTERFSNQKTTPHVMTIAAQLMAAGANQQLIATKLQTIPTPVSPRREKPKQPAQPEAGKKVNAEPQPDDGEMHINHDDEKSQPAPLPIEPAPAPVKKEVPTPKPEVAPQPEAEPEPEAEPQLELEPEPEFPIAPPAAQNFDDLKQAIQQETVKVSPQREMMAEPPAPGSHNINDNDNDNKKPQLEEESYLTSHPSWQGREIKPPSMGGTLSATAEQALEDKMQEEQEEKRNHTILTHGATSEGAPAQAPSQSKSKRRRKSKGGQGQQQKAANPAPAPAPASKPEPTPAVAPEIPPAPVTPPPVSEPEAPEPPIAAVEPTPEPVTPPESPAPIEPPAPAPVEPAPVEPTPAPQPQPEPTPVQTPAPVEQPLPEIPVAPPPLVVSEPLTPPATEVAPAPAPEVPETPPAPAPTPAAPSAPQQPEPTLEELERQAANHAAEAVAPQTISELESEREQVQPQPPAPSPLSDVPMPQPIETPAPITPEPAGVPTGMPPLPPMPDFGTLPPAPGSNGALPLLPSQPLQQPAAPQPPQELAPPPASPPAQAPTPQPQPPADPAQFRIPGQ